MTTLNGSPADIGRDSKSASLTQLLDEVNDDLPRGMLSPRVLNDPEVHAAELDKIFTRCWVFVGHVSEIPDPGDYALRYVGEDQFILVRDEHGEIHLLFNHCSHRASPVCRAEKGNTSHFRCPYHGWIYKNTGEWNGAPVRARTYRKLDAAKWGLRQAPLLDTYHGFIFACLDPDAVPLREYLGDMAWYLDMTFGLHEQGMKVAGNPQRWIVPGNWKSGADNFSGDGFHIQSLHVSAQDIGIAPQLQETPGTLHLVALDGGHGVLTGNRPPGAGPLGYAAEVAAIFDLDKLDAGKREFADRYTMVGFNVFPNFAMVAGGGVGENGELVKFHSVRQWQPRGPSEFELWTWPMVWNAAPEAASEASHRMAVRQFGSAGLFEQDDTVAWSGGPGAGRSPFARRFMKLNYQMGLDGMSDHDFIPDWPGPGYASTTGYGEINQRNFWQHWRDLLARER